LILNFENFGRVLELLINFEKASTSPYLKKCREILVLTVFNNSRPQPLFSSMVILELHRKQVYMPYFLDLAMRKKTQ